MFPSILWSSWEAETCQLSTRPCLDASEQLGGRASPPQNLWSLSNSPQALLSHPQGPQSQPLGRGALLAAHQAPCLSMWLCPQQEASGESSPGVGVGEQGREKDNSKSPCGAGTKLLGLPLLVPVSSPCVLPHHPARGNGFPLPHHGQLLNKPFPWFCPQGKRD